MAKIDQDIEDWTGSILWGISEVKKLIEAGLPDDAKSEILAQLKKIDNSIGDVQMTIEEWESDNV